MSMCLPTESLQSREVMVQKLKVAAAYEFNRFDLHIQDLEVILHELPTRMSTQIILSGNLIEEPLRTFTKVIEIVEPASWWQMLKDRHLPWLTKWFPVKLNKYQRSVEVDVSAVYPYLPHVFSGQRHYFRYMEK